MSRSIMVINPNSSERITGQIADALDENHGVSVVTSRSGPPAIETDADVDLTVLSESIRRLLESDLPQQIRLDATGTLNILSQR